jgi:hypothetical protein
MTRHEHESSWAVFCRVIDNHGDLGVCWRLASQLATSGVPVHLYVDDASALTWLAPSGCAGVSVLPWPADDAVFTAAEMPGVVIEAFGCEIPLAYQAAMAARSTPPVWVNLEYFSLEASAQRNHGLPSPVLSGPASGLTKWFYYPGWGEHSGGLLTDFRLGAIKPMPGSQHPVAPGTHGGLVCEDQQTRALSTQISASLSFESDIPNRDAPSEKHLHISVFCYEPPGLLVWLKQLAGLPAQVHLHITAGRASAAVKKAMHLLDVSSLGLDFLDYMSQTEYDHLLANMDLNLVRGEDSLVRAMCMGKPFLWQIYPQHDGVHMPKLLAFLQQTGAPEVVVQAHLAWNAYQPQALPEWTPACLRDWSDWAQKIRLHLSRQTSLAERLRGFVAAKG